VTGPGTTAPTGVVSFSTNSSGHFSAPTCTLVPIGGNQARCSVTYTPTAPGSGTHTVYANYAGDGSTPASHSSTTVAVRTGTTTALACSPGALRVDQASTCTATVTGSTHPTGTVSFATNSSGHFGSATCSLTQIGGTQAHCSVTYTPAAPGSHKIYANYAGDPANDPSHASTTVTVT
jgi:uncharacterized protein YfaP (DUF2135 family)